MNLLSSEPEVQAIFSFHQTFGGRQTPLLLFIGRFEYGECSLKEMQKVGSAKILRVNDSALRNTVIKEVFFLLYVERHFLQVQEGVKGQTTVVDLLARK